MSKVTYRTPSAKEEQKFHRLNANIIATQLLLVTSSNLAYLEISTHVSQIELMRKRNKAFNTKFGLSKEIA